MTRKHEKYEGLLARAKALPPVPRRSCIHATSRH
jgi:hypothetical protein